MESQNNAPREESVQSNAVTVNANVQAAEGATVQAVVNQTTVNVNVAEPSPEPTPLFKKILNIVKNVLVWMVVVFAVGMMIFTLVSVNTFDQSERGIFGYKFFIVRTDSMSATHFDAGDIVIVKAVDLRELKEGDVITFVSQSSDNYGETVTHMIREVTTDTDGGIAFVTYGTTTGVNDEALATIVVGKYQTRIPKLGTFFAFLKTTPGYIVCILIPFLILILSQGITCVRLFLQYRREQTAELEAERAKIDAEREETQRMMAELMALKAQLTQDAAAQQQQPAAPPTPTVPTQPEAPVQQAPTAPAEAPDNSAPTAPTAEEANNSTQNQ